MGRPRKNRVGEYAALLSEELLFQVRSIVSSEVESSLSSALDKIDSLEAKIEQLERQIKTQKKSKSRERVGRWVPGGPGRPPKDADARVSAFSQRTKKKGK